MKRTVAITGATGFAGGPTVKALVAEGHRVKALVRKPQSALPPGVEPITGDIANREALRRLIEGADAVIHLAGATSALRRDDYFAVNAEGTAAVAEAARRAGATRFVQVSSLAAREPSLSDYGASKARGEEAALATAPGVLVVRPPAVYGPGDRATLPLIKALTQSAAILPSTASSRFSLIHVEDLARILAEAAVNGRSGVVEVSDGKAGGYDWAELCAIAAAYEGRAIRPWFLPRGVTGTLAVVTEAFSKLRGTPAMVSRGKVAELYHPDWVARGEGWPLPNAIGFPQGFAETLAWYRQQGWLPPRRGASRSGSQQSQERRS